MLYQIIASIIASTFLLNNIGASDPITIDGLFNDWPRQALHHPNICTVHEIDEVEGQTFIAMAYLDYQSQSAIHIANFFREDSD